MAHGVIAMADLEVPKNSDLMISGLVETNM